MAQFYSTRGARRKKTSPKANAAVQQQQLVVGLDHQGRGVIRGEKGVRFVSGALPGERVDLRPQGKYDAELISVHNTSSERVAAPCPYYGSCGGCDLQHLALPAQREHKQQVVTELLQKFAGIHAKQWLAPLTGDAWAYRRRLRLACYWDNKREHLRLGLREKASKKIIEIQNCAIAVEPLNAQLQSLRNLLSTLPLARQLGHVELLQVSQLIVVLRLKTEPSVREQEALIAYADAHKVAFWLHIGEAENAPRPLQAEQLAPRYQTLGAELELQPGDFLQAHQQLSEKMVAQALAWLAPQADDSILELYAGSGNFTIPIAREGAQVVAIEGVPSMVKRLQENAKRLDLAVTAYHADLEQDWRDYAWAATPFNKVLLDPARAGAPQAIQEVAKRQPQRIVYVSCAPDTLARDAKHLVETGYRLEQAQIIDMFPQTHHIECLMWFEREA